MDPRDPQQSSSSKNKNIPPGGYIVPTPTPEERAALAAHLEARRAEPLSRAQASVRAFQHGIRVGRTEFERKDLFSVVDWTGLKGAMARSVEGNDRREAIGPKGEKVIYVYGEKGWAEGMGEEEYKRLRQEELERQRREEELERQRQEEELERQRREEELERQRLERLRVEGQRLWKREGGPGPSGRAARAD